MFLWVFSNILRIIEEVFSPPQLALDVYNQQEYFAYMFSKLLQPFFFACMNECLENL